MKRRTYNNVLKATKMIAAKGYEWETANKMAVKVFDDYEVYNNGMPVEWYIDKIAECEVE